MKINLGSGLDYRENWCNVDMGAVRKDVSHDLNFFPYPFRTGCAEVIEANAVVEHLPIMVQKLFLNECWRILKKGGVLIIRVPHYTSPHSVNNIEHVKGFSYRSFDAFVDLGPQNSQEDYMVEHKYASIKRRIVFGKGIQRWNHIVEWFVNKFPDAYEQSVLSAWPAEGIHVWLTK